MDDSRLGAKSGDLQPCTSEPSQVSVSVSEGQQPLAYSRPKTTYATRPKTHLHAPPIKVEETRPDDALLYTLISSTTTAPRPTFQMDEKDRVLPSLSSASSEDSVEFEPLDISEETIVEVSTLPPSTLSPTTTQKPTERVRVNFLNKKRFKTQFIYRPQLVQVLNRQLFGKQTKALVYHKTHTLPKHPHCTQDPKCQKQTDNPD